MGDFEKFVNDQTPGAGASDSFTSFLQKRRPGYDVASVIDDELARLGYGETQRLSILGDVGRENSWNRETIFRGHKDPKNAATNRGIISWQGNRRTALDNYLKQNNLLGRNDDEELRGMVRFMDEELRRDYPQVYSRLKSARSTYDASEALREYIKYVPDAPYNTYDPEFRVTNNRKWAEEARALGLAAARRQEPAAKPPGEFESFVRNNQQTPGFGDFVGDSQPVQTPVDQNQALEEYQKYIAALPKTQTAAPFAEWQKGRPAVAETQTPAPQLRDKQGNLVPFVGGEETPPVPQTPVPPQTSTAELPVIVSPGAPEPTPATAPLPKSLKLTDGRTLTETAPGKYADEKNNGFTYDGQTVRQVSDAPERPAASEDDVRAYLEFKKLPDTPENRQKFAAELAAADAARVGTSAAPVSYSTAVPGQKETQTVVATPGAAQAPTRAETPSDPTSQEIRQTYDFAPKSQKELSDFTRRETERLILSRLPNATVADVDAALGDIRTRFVPGNEKTEVSVGPGLLRAVAVERDARRLTTLNKIRLGLVTDLEKTLDGIPLDTYDPAELQTAIEMGRANRTKFDELVQRFASSENVFYRKNPSIYAAMEVGWLTQKEGDDMIDANGTLRKKLEEEERAVLEKNYSQPGAGLAGLPQFAWRARTPDEIERAVEERLAQIVREAGSARAYLNATAEAVNEQNRAFAEYQKINGGGYVFPLIMLRKVTNVVPNAVADLMRTGDIIGEALGINPYTLSFDSRPAYEREFYRAATAIREYTAAEGMGEKMTRGFAAFNELPDVAGQVVLQFVLGVTTGGTAPFLVGAAQGAAAQYEEARKFGATRNQRVFAALMGGAAAVPDYFLFNKWFGSASAAERSGFLSKFAGNLYNKYVGTGIAKEEAEELTKISLKSFFGRILVGGTLPEAAQEYSEDKINDAVALATYDPSARRRNELFTPVSEKNLMSIIGGAFGGTLGGGFQVAVEKMRYDDLAAMVSTVNLNGKEYQTPAPVVPEYVRFLQVSDQALAAYRKAEVFKENTGLKTQRQKEQYESGVKIAGEYYVEAQKIKREADARAKEILGVREFTIADAQAALSGKFTAESAGFVTVPPINQPEQVEQATTPDAEALSTVLQQVESASNPESPRAAVLLTNDEQLAELPAEIVSGFTPVPTPEGPLLVSNEKAAALGLQTPAEVQEYVNQNGFAQLIGKVEDLTGRTDDGLVAVRTTDAAGNELTTSVVDDPLNIERQMELDAAQFPGVEVTQEVTTVEESDRLRREQVATERAAGRTNRFRVETLRPATADTIAQNTPETELAPEGPFTAAMREARETPLAAEYNEASRDRNRRGEFYQKRGQIVRFDNYNSLANARGITEEVDFRPQDVGTYMAVSEGGQTFAVPTFGTAVDNNFIQVGGKHLYEFQGLKVREVDGRLLPDVENASDYTVVRPAKIKVEGGKVTILEKGLIKFKDGKIVDLTSPSPTPFTDAIRGGLAPDPSPAGQSEPVAPSPSENTQTDAPAFDLVRVVNVGDESVGLTAEQAARWAEEVEKPLADAKRRRDFELQRNPVDYQRIEANYKGEAMRIAAVKREIADRLTDKERAAKERREKSNFIGKKVSVNGLDGKVVGNVFGKVKVEFENGETRIVSADEIAPPSSNETGNLKSASTPMFFQPTPPDADYLFGKVVDKLLKGLISRHLSLSLGGPPKVLRALGVNNLTVLLPGDHVFKAIEESHNVHVETIKMLPSLLADPVMVFESDTVKNAIVVIVDAVDRGGFPVMAAIHLDRKTDRKTAHRIASVYGRENYRSYNEWVQDGRLLYYNKQKLPVWNTTHKLQLLRVVQTKQATQSIETNESIVKRPLKKAATDAAENLLTEILPGAPMEQVVTGVESKFTGENLEINENGAEILRRLMAERHFQDTALEIDEVPFDAITLDGNYLRGIAALGREFLPEFESAGYAASDLAGFTELLDNFDRLAEQTAGIAYVFDHALPEEQIHKEDLTAGRTDARAVENLKQSEFWQNPGELFDRQYPNLTDADRASEIAAKLATDQAAKYGWDKIADFEAKRDAFLREWADGVVRNNESAIESNGIDWFVNKFARIAKYVDFTKSDTGRNSESRGDQSPQRTDQASGRPPKERPAQEPDQPVQNREENTDDAGKLKERRTVTSAEAVGAVEDGAITGEARYYTTKSRDANVRRAQEQIETVGLDKAIVTASTPPARPSGEFTAYQMEVVRLLNRQADEAMDAGNDAVAAAKLAAAQTVVTAMAETATDLGQAISQLANWQKTDPEAVAGYVQKRRAQNQYHENLTPAEAKMLRESAQKLQELEAQVADMQARIDDLNQKLEAGAKAKNKLTRKITEEVKAKADSALAALREQFPAPAQKSVALKSAAPLADLTAQRLDPDTLQRFAAVGAGILHDKKGGPMTLKEFYNEMVKLFGRDIRPHLAEIHALSEKELTNIRREIYRQRRIETLQAIEGNADLTTADLNEIVDKEIEARNEAARVRGERKRAANKYFKEQQNELDDLPSFAKSLFKVAGVKNKEILLGALLLETKQVSSADGLARRLREIFVDMGPAAALNAASLAARARKQAHTDLAAERARIKEQSGALDAERAAANKERNEAMRVLLNRIKFLENPPPSYSQRLGRVFKAALVSAVQTTVTNFTMAEGTRGIETLTDLAELAINKALSRAGVELRDSAIAPQTRISDVLGFLSSEDTIVNALGQNFLDAIFARGIAGSVLDEFPTLYEYLFGSYASDIAVMREGTEQGGLVDAAMQKVEKAYEYANTLNYYQEFLVRSQEFNRALQIRLGARGQKLREMIDNKTLSEIPIEDLKFAVDRALRVTFAANPARDTVSDKLLNLYLRHVPGVLAPFGITFPKFLYNASSFISDYAPVIGLLKAGYVNKKELNSGYLKGLANLSTRQAAYQLVGTTLFLAALALVRAAGDDDKWYYLRVPGTAHYIDIRGYQPFAAFVFLANKFNRIVQGKSAFSDEDTAFSETLEALAGLSTRNLTENKLVGIVTGTIGALGDATGAAPSKDGRDWERVGYLFRQQLGEIGGGILRPLKVIKDVVAQFDEYEAKQPDVIDSPFSAGLARSLPFSNRLLGLKPRENYVTGETYASPAPALKIFGVNVIDPKMHKEVPSKALVLLREMTENFQKTKDVLTQRKAQIKSEIYRAMREAGDDPEKLDRVNRAIERAEKDGILQPREIEPIERQKGLNEIQSKAKQVGFDKLAPVFKAASDSERQLLAGVVTERAANLNKTRKLTPKDVEAIKKYMPDFTIDLRPPLTIYEQVKSMSTDKTVEYFLENRAGLSAQQRKEFLELLKQKASNAAERGTLTDGELETVRELLPDFTPKPKLPKMKKRPSAFKKEEKFGSLKSAAN